MPEVARGDGALNPLSEAPISIEPFETGGYPVHTRTLIVELLQDADSRMRALATILDLRKQGWVPTGGELQTAGLIHHMSLDVLVDAASGLIERFAPSQQVVAFEPSGRTAGESCRDPVHLLRGMVGEKLDAGNARRLRELFGGPLGCSHLLTLAQLVLSFLPGTIAREARNMSAKPVRRESGERIATRVLVIDGFERRDGNQEIAIQLTDVHTSPFAAMAGMLDRFGAEHEVRAIMRVDDATSTISAHDVAERARTRTELGAATWQSRSDELGWLHGHPVMRGLAPGLLRRYGAEPTREPLLAALINFAPSYMQSLSPRVTRMIEQETDEGIRPTVMDESGVSGFPDSCYIWRTTGRMTRMRLARRGQASD